MCHSMKLSRIGALERWTYCKRAPNTLLTANMIRKITYKGKAILKPAYIIDYNESTSFIDKTDMLLSSTKCLIEEV